MRRPRLFPSDPLNPFMGLALGTYFWVIHALWDLVYYRVDPFAPIW